MKAPYLSLLLGRYMALFVFNKLPTTPPGGVQTGHIPDRTDRAHS